MKKQLEKAKGITLIALVITIIILLILAGVSIATLTGEGGILSKAQQSKEFYELEEEKERLELVKAEVLIENNGKITVEQYIEELKKRGITIEDDITSNLDGSKNCITDKGYSVLIEQLEDNNVSIIVEGKIGQLPPRILKLTVTSTASSITINIEVRRGEETTYQYYIKKQAEEDYPEKPVYEGEKLNCTIENLEQNEKYTIKVVAINKNGKNEKETLGITGKQLVTEIIIEPSATRLKPGDKLALTATILPENANDRDIIWTSSDPTIASVNERGEVEGIVEGSTTIKATAVDEGKCYGICNVTVREPRVSDLTEIQEEPINVKDDRGNFVKIPGGFKVAKDSGATVQQGIVIEDAKGNQFVWIPVSNINHDGSNKIKLDNNSEVEITLGRYTFNETTGAPTKIQYGSEYQQLQAESYGKYIEVIGFRESNYGHYGGYNATAKDLAGFIASVSRNKGYYFARFEPSYASGSTFGVGNDSSYFNVFSTVSTSLKTGSNSWTPKMKMTGIREGDASKASRQMYYGHQYVDSDLCNSYAWDTALVYIQSMGHNNYANASGATSLGNTGTTNDQVCKIFDMAGNSVEYTTETRYWKFSSGEIRAATRRGSGYRRSRTTVNAMMAIQTVHMMAMLLFE